MMVTKQAVVANQRREPRASAGGRWGWGPSANQKKQTQSAVTANQRRGFLAALLLLTLACTKEVSYVDSISEWRTTKDAFMQRSPDSPIPADRRASFPPLSYFPIEPEYRVPASLTVNRTSDVIEIPTSRGERRPHNRVGQLSFTLKGRLLTLTAFVEVGQQDVNHLFVPFGDLTNGTETYPGGRYLELDRTPTGIYDLDFNRAFHPFCYYNPQYDCPYPPRENRLPIPIRAGERMSAAGH
jgi:uncharacterized protein (DUF1684 family)